MGKTKSFVMATLGNQHNNYASDVWQYNHNTGWWFMKKHLVVRVFFENDKVIRISKYYKKTKAL